MRQFFITSFIILALGVGAAGAAPAAHAADCTVDTIGQSCTPTGGGTGKCVQTEIGVACSASGAAEAVSPTAGTQNPVPYNSDSTDAAYNGVMIKIMSLFAWLVGVAAITLDNAVYYTVVTMGDYVNKLSAIGVAWRILRDLANIMLIFGFLGTGIAIILNVDKYGFGTKLLPKLLVAAVLINFSLFISEAMIDGTNLVATQVYTQINGGNPAGKPVDTGTIINATSNGIASKIMGQLGLQSLYGEATKSDKSLFSGGNPWYIGFMGILLFITTAFVMFSLAFILIARFVALIFLILVSPIAIMGWALPMMEYRAKQWWDNFLQQIITAPVLLLLLYVALAVITDAQFLTGFGEKPEWLGFVNGSNGTNFTGFAGMMLSFLVAMGLLLVVVIKAKSMSAFGAAGATKLAGKLTFGATAYGASTLFGGTAFGIRKGLQRYAPNSRIAHVASRGLRFAEGMKMDVRSLPGVGAGLAAGGAGGPIGKSATGRVRQAGDWLKKSGQESDRQHDQETRMPRLRAAITANDNATVARILGNMSDKELEESAMQRLLANPANSAVAAALAQNRFDKLLTSDVLNDAQKNNLRTQRQAGLNARYADPVVYHNSPTHPTAPGAVIPSIRHPGTDMSRGEQAIRTLTNEAASQLSDASMIRPEVHENLSIRQLNAISNAGKIQDTTATTVGNFLRADPTFVAYFAGRNPQQQADLRAFWHI